MADSDEVMLVCLSEIILVSKDLCRWAIWNILGFAASILLSLSNNSTKKEATLDSFSVKQSSRSSFGDALKAITDLTNDYRREYHAVS